MQRREFMAISAATATAMIVNRLAGAESLAKPPDSASSYDAWIAARHKHMVSRTNLEAFLQPPPNNQWAKFDAELGYVPSDSIQRDGIDGTSSVYRYGPAGERRIVNYPDRPCRLNTYGNSFTQCHQVSDGETWQEHLAAHLGEPIRNFGVGGYGVFQAFARLRRMEQTESRAPYLIFNIFDDDHLRTIMPWRGFAINYAPPADLFHANPWTHLRVNLDSGQWEEMPNPAPSPSSLRDLLSLDKMRLIVAEHEMTHLLAMIEGVADVPRERIRRLADWAGMKFDFSDVASRRTSAETLRNLVARASTVHVMGKLVDFAAAQQRRLMVVLSYGTRAVIRACEGGAKQEADVSLLRWLGDRGIPTFDSLDAHVVDYANFRISAADYVKRYYIGHYSPVGNQFFAYALKQAVVGWLDPKPIAYQPHGTIVDFQDGRYLDKLPAK